MYNNSKLSGAGIKKRKNQRKTIKWFGQIQRMGEEKSSKGMLHMNVKGIPLRDRPKDRWKDQVRSNIQKSGHDCDGINREKL